MPNFGLAGLLPGPYADAESDGPDRENDRTHPSVRKRPELMSNLWLQPCNGCKAVMLAARLLRTCSKAI
jgi:hypothetical protein